MTARVIRVSYDGGSIEVEPYDRTTRPYAHPTADGRIVLDVIERGLDRAVLHLTAEEVGAHIADCVSALAELDGLTRLDVLRRLADAEEQLATQAAPDGAGAAPTGDGGDAGDQRLSPQHDDGGHTRTTATGLSNPPAESGRLTHVHTEGREDCTHCLPQCCSGCHDDESARAVAQRLAHETHLDAVDRQLATDEDRPFGERMALHEEDPGPDDMAEPDEPIGHLAGGNYYRSATVIDALRRARNELLANSTLVGDAR